MATKALDGRKREKRCEHFSSDEMWMGIYLNEDMHIKMNADSGPTTGEIHTGRTASVITMFARASAAIRIVEIHRYFCWMRLEGGKVVYTKTKIKIRTCNAKDQSAPLGFKSTLAGLLGMVRVILISQRFNGHIRAPFFVVIGQHCHSNSSPPE